MKLSGDFGWALYQDVLVSSEAREEFPQNFKKKLQVIPPPQALSVAYNAAKAKDAGATFVACNTSSITCTISWDTCSHVIQHLFGRKESFHGRHYEQQWFYGEQPIAQIERTKIDHQPAPKETSQQSI